MALTTTTVASIIDAQIALIEALTAGQPGGQFRRCPPDKRLREWAPIAGSGCFRAFEIRRHGPLNEPGMHDPSARFVTREVVVSVAYPRLLGLYGINRIDDLAEVAEADAAQIRDALISPSNAASGQLAAIVTEPELDESADAVIYLDLAVEIKFWKSQSIT